ncbi:3-hydroxyacyl-ACP dehydratase FabZ family protein [Flavobacterium aquatile]|uniref:Hydroxymyristoyl-ACP dehydratase n=1 Tax=Flavobacterium aquatile LMG 4008 = ATCC 11947 TaxID=1453498 RepID=A0A095TZF9_9FLAO|nr:3-hydroxyacyl-ACP dehydratase FabZ family protein [Flavobacterium aquatile]KGD67783.1 hydroxymyristoyl-ACP dehydratase [Flavobacterium aquatile LMG 4008 = ATCC 11947]OXA67643.1 hydroxymyristoyl-ACP dehydratase [Flavobacterium aquatile LMG 4008 = ATCC 11947]GEC78279.1 beta-hydroxyacyl-ACP dehydratase [Flavobacterium aquatile]
MTQDEIISKLPYSKPFLFVDEITSISEDGVVGNYTFDEKLDFYKGHFIDNPVTPGVILTEVMAQIGVVCLGIYLLNNEINKNTLIALTSSNIEYLRPVFPKEKVVVISEKIYFRFGKLKCKVKMINDSGIEVCNGTIAGMIYEK